MISTLTAETEQEQACEYVSSRGILKSCDIYSLTPVSSIRQMINYNVSSIRPYSIIYVCASAIPYFANAVSAHITVPYVLVSGDCDETVPTDIFASNDHFAAFINSPNLIHWFSQNCVLNTHPKLSQIPIGLDYHTLAPPPGRTQPTPTQEQKAHEWGPMNSPLQQEIMLKQIAGNARPVNQRIPKAYSNFHFFVNSKFGTDRANAMAQIPKNLVYYEPTKIKRINTWINQSEYAFVISPHGNGYDCHRTWEALALGCIPIVKTSPMDSLFAELPVLIVNEWTDVTQNRLLSAMREFQEWKKWEKLGLRYWVDKIKGHAVL